MNQKSREPIPDISTASFAGRPSALRHGWIICSICFFLAAMVWIIFGQALHFSFVDFDDDAYVYQNPIVLGGLTWSGITWAFTHTHSSNWHPLTWISHMLDCQLYGPNPGGPHLTNIILHAATAILLFLVLRQLTATLWRSAFVAAVFAIHPLHVESVAWIAERKDVLSGFFFMLTIWTYVRYARQPWSLGRYLPVVLLFVLGLLSKPMLVTLPFVLLLLDFWPLNRLPSGETTGFIFHAGSRRIPKRVLYEKIPLFILAAASCAATLCAQREAMTSLPLSLRVGNALVSYVTYLRQMFCPSDLVAFYPYPESGHPFWKIAVAIMLLLLISLGVLGVRRRQPWLLTGWLWYLGMLVPTIGILQVGAQAHADRYTYLPQIGLYIMLTWTAAEFCANRRMVHPLLGSAAAIVILSLTFYARTQTAYWRNSETLWTHALAYTSDNITAHINLGNALLDDGRVDGALAHFKTAVQLAPGDAQAHYNLGNALLLKHEADPAIFQFKQALAIKPGYVEAFINLGNAYFQQGNGTAAIASLEKALQLKTDDAQACYDLGNAFSQKGDFDQAILYFQKALQLKPDDAETGNNLGNALLQKGRVDAAIARFEKTIQLQPHDAKACYNLGIAYLQQGNLDAAMTQFQKAFQLKPDNAEAAYNLGLAFLQKGNLDEAINHFQKVQQIRPDKTETYANASYELGNIFIQRGNADAAVTDYQKALTLEPGWAEAHYNLGIAFTQKGRMDEAIVEYQKALQSRTDYSDAKNNLAWIWATAPQASLRQGLKALELARQANELAGGKDPDILDTLAAAYAEIGQYNEAKVNAQKAINFARIAGQPEQVAQLTRELKFYEAGQPYHQENN